MNPLTRKNSLNFVNELLNWKRKTKSKKKSTQNQRYRMINDYDDYDEFYKRSINKDVFKKRRFWLCYFTWN